MIIAVKPSLFCSIFVFGFFLIAGCSTPRVRLGSVGNVQIDYDQGREISARACGLQLFTFIPVSINNRFGKANRALFRQAEGHYIGNVKIQESWRYYFFVTTHCTKLIATAYPITTHQP